MAKYRKAAEGSKKGISTDKLSLADAKEYFQGRSKETGAKQFRWNGEVYDLSGNKVSKASGTGKARSAKASEGPARPRANPARNPGGARPEPGKAGGMPAAKPKGRDANPVAVGAMTAGAVAAGIAAARSGRGTSKTAATPASSRPALPKPAEVKALPSPTNGGTIFQAPDKPKALPKPEPKVETKAKPKKKVKPRSGGSRAGVRGGAAVVGTGGGVGRSNVDKALDPLNLMNKGGLVRKKK